jgi:hypothetical protein
VHTKQSNFIKQRKITDTNLICGQIMFLILKVHTYGIIIPEYHVGQQNLVYINKKLLLCLLTLELSCFSFRAENLGQNTDLYNSSGTHTV